MQNFQAAILKTCSFSVFEALPFEVFRVEGMHSRLCSCHTFEILVFDRVYWLRGQFRRVNLESLPFQHYLDSPFRFEREETCWHSPWIRCHIAWRSQSTELKAEPSLLTQNEIYGIWYDFASKLLSRECSVTCLSISLLVQLEFKTMCTIGKDLTRNVLRYQNVSFFWHLVSVNWIENYYTIELSIAGRQSRQVAAKIHSGRELFIYSALIHYLT